jgi:electron transfer flavoprotein alpha subunit
MSADIFVLIEHLKVQVSDLSYMMLAAGRSLASASGGKLKALLLGQDARGLAADLAADCVIYVDHPALAEFTPEAYRRTLAAIIERESPWVVLIGETSIGADLAGGLSAQLDVPLVSLCRTLSADSGKLGFQCQICGGKILAEGHLPETTTLVTMVPGAYKPEDGKAASPAEVTLMEAPDLAGLRVSMKSFIEPEAGDVDITREEILVAVGRGIQQENNLEITEELAQALGGALCASRPVVDQGWMSTSRLVGKSGKHVKPKVYLAIGISGAPEHLEGIRDADLLLAINTDEKAPIFDVADYGVTADLFELVPVLTEKIQAAKGG